MASDDPLFSSKVMRFYVGVIERAKAGDERGVIYLRRKLRELSWEMPDTLVIELSEAVARFRKAEMKGETESN